MTVTPGEIAGVFVVDSATLQDERGFFRETYQLGELETAVGREVRFRQNNHSRSRPGVLRGFHSEPWDKLVYVTRGRALCVIADIRPESATFGSTMRIELGDGSRRRVFISRGLANAFLALDETDYVNDVSEQFAAEGRGGVRWDDPTLAVDWPVEQPVLSDFDRALPTLAELLPDHPGVRRS